MSEGLPQKLYFRIGEVAGIVGVEPHVLRYWEREFRTIRPTKSARGQRVYSRRDVENLLRVRELLYTQGFTIAGARKQLLRPGQPAAPAEKRAEKLETSDGHAPPVDSSSAARLRRLRLTYSPTVAPVTTSNILRKWKVEQLASAAALPYSISPSRFRSRYSTAASMRSCQLMAPSCVPSQ